MSKKPKPVKDKPKIKTYRYETKVSKARLEFVHGSMFTWYNVYLGKKKIVTLATSFEEAVAQLKELGYTLKDIPGHGQLILSQRERVKTRAKPKRKPASKTAKARAVLKEWDDDSPIDLIDMDDD